MWWPFPKRKPAPRPYRYPHSVDELHRDYKHVICINPDHIPWRVQDPFKEIRQWAQDNCCGIVVDRVLWDWSNQRWCSNGIGGVDLAFFGTNDESIAMLARLRWGTA